MIMNSIKAYILPIICVIASIVLVIVVINPSLAKLKVVKQQLVELRQSEDRVKELMALYDTLRSTYQQITDQDKQTLEKALPANINNVRLILELERIAELHGLGFKDVNVVLKEDQAGAASQDQRSQQLRKVEASVTLVGDYAAFIKYLTDLEKSLRILTLRSIDFRTVRIKDKPTEFEYDLTLETYWFVYPEAAPLSGNSSTVTP